MKALVYGGPGQKSWTEAPDRQIIDPRDAIIRVDTVTICGTDLHILGGDVPAVQSGRVLGHEAVGTVHAVGGAVSGVRVGDRVLASCISACGSCSYCRQASYGQCRNGGGWILGHLVDGVQAQYARIPFGDLSTHKLPAAITDEVAVLLADILPTSFEVGVTNGHVQPGDTVTVVGTGPIGLAAILTARLYSPSHIIAIDKAESRLQAAKQFGADITIKPDDNPLKAVRGITDGLGADVVHEAVGTPETFERGGESVVVHRSREANVHCPGFVAGPAATGQVGRDAEHPGVVRHHRANELGDTLSARPRGQVLQEEGADSVSAVGFVYKRRELRLLVASVRSYDATPMTVPACSARITACWASGARTIRSTSCSMTSGPAEPKKRSRRLSADPRR
jgi:alcohol dehydrogenase